MSDVDTQGEGAEVEPLEMTPVEEAVAEFQPIGTVVYPETDAVRAAMTGGLPAGNADDVPPGTSEIQAAATEQFFTDEEEVAPSAKGNARDARWTPGESGGDLESQPQE